MHRRKSYQGQVEQLENRMLLTVGPFVHTHILEPAGNDRLLVVDTSSGDVKSNKQIANNQFELDDETKDLADIAFDSKGRLYGVTHDWLYEISTVDGTLTSIGPHGVLDANALVFDASDNVWLMGLDSPLVTRLRIKDSQIDVAPPPLSSITLNGVIGSAGDIAFHDGDLIVAEQEADQGNPLHRLRVYRPTQNSNRLSPRETIDLDIDSNQEILGLAVVDDSLFVTVENDLYEYDLNSKTLSSSITQVDGFTDFLQGAAYYAENNGPVPAGTISGIKWNDADGDGKFDNNEEVLTDWQIYLDLNVNGQFDPETEPVERTDAKGRYHFFGYQPGFYTVDEINPDPGAWVQTYPETLHRNLVGIYKFDNQRTVNSLFHPNGLPDLFRDPSTTFVGSSIRLPRRTSFVELPIALGVEMPEANDVPQASSQFTVAVKGFFNNPFPGGFNPYPEGGYLVSQGDSISDNLLDFKATVDFDSPNELDVSFCTTSCQSKGNEFIRFNRLDEFAVTWNEIRVGNFVDNKITFSQNLSNPPDIDGDSVRFGQPTDPSNLPYGITGDIGEVRIYNAALPASELITAFTNRRIPDAYSVLLTETDGIQDLDFGNQSLLPPTAPEIDVWLDSDFTIELADDGLLDFGTIEETADDAEFSRDIWIQNTGDDTLFISDVTDPALFDVRCDGNCITSIEPRMNVKMTVTLSKSARTVGVKNSQFSIRNNDAPMENNYLIRLKAEIIEEIVLAPEINLRFSGPNGPLISNNSIRFPDVREGEEAPSVDVWIENIGADVLSITNIQIVSGDFEILGNLPTAIDPDDGALITIRPTHTNPGVNSGLLVIENNDPDESRLQVLLLAIVEKVAPAIQLRKGTANGPLIPNGGLFDFGSFAFGQTAIGTLFFKNNGNEELTLMDLEVSGEVIHSDLTQTNLQPGESTSIVLLFSDTTPGPLSGSLTIHSNDEDSTPYTIQLKATIEAAQPDIEVRRGSADGPVLTSGDTVHIGTTKPDDSRPQEDFWITNTGVDALDLSKIETTGDFVVSGFQATILAPSASTNFRVRVSDSAIGEKKGTVTIQSDDPDEASFALNLQASIISGFNAHNEQNPPDVNNDGFVAPIDVLLIVNELNRPTFTDPTTHEIIAPPIAPTFFPDVTNDGFLAPVDILLIVNAINSALPPAAVADLTTSEPLNDLSPKAVDIALWYAADDDEFNRDRKRNGFV